jgi:hypothetical protein
MRRRDGEEEEIESGEGRKEEKDRRQLIQLQNISWPAPDDTGIIRL